MNSIMNENEYIKNGAMIIFFSLIVCEHVYPVLCHTGEKHLGYGIPRIIEYRLTLWVKRSSWILTAVSSLYHTFVLARHDDIDLS